MADVKDIEEKLLDFLSSMFQKADPPINAGTSLEGIGIDSLSLVELFVFIEKNFNLKLIESNVSQENLKSIESLASYIACEL